MENTQDKNFYNFNEVPFRQTIFDKIIRKDDKSELPWTIHPDLQKAVYEGSLTDCKELNLKSQVFNYIYPKSYYNQCATYNGMIKTP